MAHASTPALSFRGRLLLSLPAALLAGSLSAQDGAGWFTAWHPTASATAAWVDNISRTSNEPTRKESATYEAAFAGSRARQLASSVLLLGHLNLSSLLVDKYELANRTEAGGQLTLQKKFGLGPQAWVLQGAVGGRYKLARLSDDRGWTTEASVQLAKRVLPTLRLAASARWLEHAADSAVFDLNQHAVALEAQWDFAERWTLSGSISRLQGDIVANAAGPVWATALTGGFGGTVQGYYRSRPWSVAELYGPAWVSYNVEADVDLWHAALTFAWTDRTSLEFRKSAAYVVNRIGIAYPTDSWSLTLAYRF